MISKNDKMMKYAYRESEMENNSENLFIHRFHGNGAVSVATDVRLSTPTTFWKSPYTGDVGVNNSSRGIYMKPVISVTSTKKQTTSVDDTSKLTRKSILKHRTMENNTDIANSQSSSEPQPNLITTGTGTGRPYGSPVRSQTAGKRVQFNGVPKQNNFSLKKNWAQATSTPNFYGRRLFLDRRTSTRILGTPKNSSPRWEASRNQSNVTLNGGEANIKSQISEFIRKLRLAKSEQYAMEEMEKTRVTESQNKTAAKFRKSRSFSGTPNRPDWNEFDMDKVQQNQTQCTDNESNQNQTENAPYIVYDAKNRSLSSGSISIESFSSVSEEQVVEQTPGGAKIFRPKPNASLYTKYKHITTNEHVNKYGQRPNSYLELEKEKQSVNFCDKRKTSQILGWLEDVRSAKTESS